MEIPKQSSIKWKRQDYLTLGREVARFNKKINELNKLENRSYLPSTKNYKEVKSNITTRKELNRVLSSLRGFSKENATDKIKLEGGQELTKWEYKELKKQRRIAEARLLSEIKELKEKPISAGFTRAQMRKFRITKSRRYFKKFE